MITIILIIIKLLSPEVEQATDFLQKAGLSDLTKIYNQGIEISDSIVNESVRQRHLTEKQASTVKSRVKMLNKTLRNRQYTRKQRQDIRDVAWNIEVIQKKLWNTQIIYH